VDLENIHAPALDGAYVGCSDRNGKESQLGADQDQNKCACLARMTAPWVCGKL
jgi:hypothetical protein